MTPSPTEGRRGIVLGGTHGIGLAMAEEMIRARPQVVVTDRHAGMARAAEARLGAAGTVKAGDITDRGHIASLAAKAGDVDALLVNVRIAEPDPVAEASWDRQFDVNAKAAFFCAQALAPTLTSARA